ncbi:serine/threonine protein kinase [Glycomyces sp. NPDC046736]|uniref:serine/threonine-protein kinase n=1 Tax=Glycomyces sp. NPDC046736 TaxID=3155615 RepID=UPI003403C193
MHPLAPRETTDVEPGTRIADRFRLDERIDAGGMGSVWKAFDLRLGRDVAVKILRHTLDGEFSPVDRFSREAQTLASLKGEGFVEIYDFGQDESGAEPLWYIAMELVETGSLGDLIDERGAIRPEDTMRFMAEAAAALGKAHRIGVVHRDVKPGNLLVDPEGRIRVVDFGISLLTDRTRLTPADTSYGTLAYAAPEQLRHAEVTGRSDLYSLGVVAYECLTGTTPFAAADPATQVHGQLYEEPPPLPDFVPGPISDIVMRCLRKEPEERFAGAEELAAACLAAEHQVRADAIQPAPPPDDPPPPEKEQNGNTKRLALVAALVVVLLAAGTTAILRPWERRPSEPDLTVDQTTDLLGEPLSPSHEPDESPSPSEDETSTATEDEILLDDGEPTEDAGESEPGTATEQSTPDKPASTSAEMPDLISQNSHSAMDQLDDLGFTDVSISRMFGTWLGLEECDINFQDPAGGNVVPLDEPITLGYTSAEGDDNDCA